MKNLKSMLCIVFLGTSLVFIGHGVQAAQQSPVWVALFNNSLNHLPAGAPDHSTVASWTRIIGFADILFGAVLGFLGIGVIAGWFTSFFASRPAILILAIAAFWEFMTSAAVMVADGTLLPGLWVLLERSPSFLMPIIGVMLIRTLRERQL